MPKPFPMSSATLAEITEATGVRLTENNRVILRESAKLLVVGFSKRHEKSMPSDIAFHREELVVAVMKGMGIREAFRTIAGVEVIDEGERREEAKAA